MLTFVVAGGGPTGVESAGAIAELVHNVLPRDYPGEHLRQARVVLLEAAGRLLPAMPESLAAHTLRTLERKDVEVRFGAAVSGFDGRAVQLKDGEEIPARTLIWAAGIQAAGLVSALPLEKGSQGRVKVLPTLQAPARPEVFVIGDAAYLPDADGRPLPMVAPVAMQQGELVGRNITRILRGRGARRRSATATPARWRRSGAARRWLSIGPVKLHGLIAWLAWVAVHIYQLVGFRNRLAVMMDWAWNYFVYDRPVRMIDARERRGTPEPPPLAAQIEIQHPAADVGLLSPKPNHPSPFVPLTPSGALTSVPQRGRGIFAENRCSGQHMLTLQHLFSAYFSRPKTGAGRGGVENL